MEYDDEIFSGKKFSDITKDLYTINQDKRDQIKILIDDLRSLIKTTDNAIMLAPLIKDYLDVSVRNDDILNKLVATIQRHISLSAKKDISDDGELLSDSDWDELRRNVEDVIDDDNKVTNIKKQIDKQNEEAKEVLDIEKEMDEL